MGRYNTHRGTKNRTCPIRNSTLGMINKTEDTQATIEHRITGFNFDQVQFLGIHCSCAGSIKDFGTLTGELVLRESPGLGTSPFSLVCGLPGGKDAIFDQGMCRR